MPGVLRYFLAARPTGSPAQPQRLALRAFLLLAFLSIAGLDAASAADLTDIDAIDIAIGQAQGTYPAAKLPTMCVSIHQTTASPEQNLALLQKLRIPCARSDNLWHLIEAGQGGHYDWSGADPLWSKLCNAGIRPIMIATYNNPIYAAGVFRPIAGEPDVTGFKNFAVAIADHYAGICPNLIEELFNEPNAINWTTTPWSGSSYAAMLAPVSAAIKTAHPAVTVFSAGLGFDAEDPSTWIAQMVTAGQTFHHVDAYAFHPYNYDERDAAKTPPPEHMLIDVGHFARDAGTSGQAKPIALTEYGFPLQALGGNLKRQGIYAARGMLAAIIGRYPFHTYYDLIDDGTDYTNAQNTFGLFLNENAAHPFAIKPAGLAFGAIMSAMAGAKSFSIGFDPRLSTASIAFQKTNATTYVFWTYDETGTKSVTQRLGSFQHVRCHDLFGTDHQCLYTDENLSLSLTEEEGPIIVTAVR
jgi:hypothetical protein